MVTLMLSCRMGTARQINGPFDEGVTMSVSGKDVEFDRPIDRRDFLSGACFGRGVPANYQPNAPASSVTVKKKFVVPTLSKPTTSLTSRPALQDVSISASQKLEGTSEPRREEESHWTANWFVHPSSSCLRALTLPRRKQQTKKHKTWDGDAYISLVSGLVKLISETGKV